MSDGATPTTNPPARLTTRFGQRYTRCAIGMELLALFEEAGNPTHSEDGYFLMLYEDNIRECRSLLIDHYQSCPLCGSRLTVVQALRYEMKRIGDKVTSVLARVFSRLETSPGWRSRQR